MDWGAKDLGGILTGGQKTWEAEGLGGKRPGGILVGGKRVGGILLGGKWSVTYFARPL